MKTPHVVFLPVIFLSFFPIALQIKTSLHSPEEVTSDPRILRWVMFFPYLSLASLNGLVL